MNDSAFADLLDANRAFAADFDLAGLEGRARAGVAVVTCMDARIDPLRVLGLETGDAKVLRNPGGQVTDQVLTGLALAVNLLGVDRVLVVQHTRCAMASAPEADLRRRLGDAAGTDTAWMRLGAIADQRDAVADDVHRVRAHPVISGRATVGGFVYDVDTGLLDQVV